MNTDSLITDKIKEWKAEQDLEKAFPFVNPHFLIGRFIADLEQLREQKPDNLVHIVGCIYCGAAGFKASGDCAVCGKPQPNEKREQKPNEEKKLTEHWGINDAAEKQMDELIIGIAENERKEREEQPEAIPRFVKTEERNPTKSGNYYSYRLPNKVYPQVVWWYVDTKEWSSTTYEWLEESKPEELKVPGKDVS